MRDQYTSSDAVAFLCVVDPNSQVGTEVKVGWKPAAQCLIDSAVYLRSYGITFTGTVLYLDAANYWAISKPRGAA